MAAPARLGRSSWSRFLFAASLGAVLVAGCSGADEAAEPSGRPVGEDPEGKKRDVPRSDPADAATPAEPAGPTADEACTAFADAFCESYEARCLRTALQVEYVDLAGATCGWVAPDGAWTACAGSECQFADTKVLTGTCPGLAEDGAPCGGTTRCRLGASCDNGRCVLMTPSVCSK